MAWWATVIYVALVLTSIVAMNVKNERTGRTLLSIVMLTLTICVYCMYLYGTEICIRFIF